MKTEKPILINALGRALDAPINCFEPCSNPTRFPGSSKTQTRTSTAAQLQLTKLPTPGPQLIYMRTRRDLPKHRFPGTEDLEDRKRPLLAGISTGGDSSRSSFLIAGQPRKWMILMATIWIQAFTGTNFDFSAYSTDLKSVLGISQVQLNYLAVASDLGKAFGWSSGLALLYLPLWAVLFMAASMGFVGYGIQWLVIRNLISLPYFVIFKSHLM